MSKTIAISFLGIILLLAFLIVIYTIEDVNRSMMLSAFQIILGAYLISKLQKKD